MNFKTDLQKKNHNTGTGNYNEIFFFLEIKSPDQTSQNLLIRKLKIYLDLHFNGQLLTPVTHMYIVLYIAKVSIQVLDKFECSLDKISVTTTVHTSARLSMRKGGGTSSASPNTIK